MSAERSSHASARACRPSPAGAHAGATARKRVRQARRRRRAQHRPLREVRQGRRACHKLGGLLEAVQPDDKLYVRVPQRHLALEGVRHARAVRLPVPAAGLPASWGQISSAYTRSLCSRPPLTSLHGAQALAEAAASASKVTLPKVFGAR